MDVRAPALIHTRGYGLAVTLYHGEGEKGIGSEGEAEGLCTFALRRWVHMRGAVVTG